MTDSSPGFIYISNKAYYFIRTRPEHKLFSFTPRKGRVFLSVQYNSIGYRCGSVAEAGNGQLARGEQPKDSHSMQAL